MRVSGPASHPSPLDVSSSHNRCLVQRHDLEIVEPVGLDDKWPGRGVDPVLPAGGIAPAGGDQPELRRNEPFKCHPVLTPDGFLHFVLESNDLRANTLVHDPSLTRQPARPRPAATPFPYFVLDSLDGGIVADSEHIITGGRDNKTARTVALYEDQPINAPALAATFEQIIAKRPRRRVAGDQATCVGLSERWQSPRATND